MGAGKTEMVEVRYLKLKNINIRIDDIAEEKAHEHAALEIGTVLSGSAVVKIPSSERTIHRGGLYLIDAYEAHAVRSASAEPACVLTIWISAAFGMDYFMRISSISFECDMMEKLLPQRSEALRGSIIALAKAYFSEEENYQLECVGRINLLLAELMWEIPYTISNDAEKMIKDKAKYRKHRISEYIEQHYKERLTLSDIANMENVTTIYMSSAFKQLFGISFQEYLNYVRLEEALLLIRNPSLYLVDICIACGFSDTRYMNSIFHKEINYSASEYRKKYARLNPPRLCPDFAAERRSRSTAAGKA